MLQTTKKQQEKLWTFCHRRRRCKKKNFFLSSTFPIHHAIRKSSFSLFFRQRAKPTAMKVENGNVPSEIAAAWWCEKRRQSRMLWYENELWTVASALLIFKWKAQTVVVENFSLISVVQVWRWKFLIQNLKITTSNYSAIQKKNFPPSLTIKIQLT